ncbi:hypothetical protein K491DRAFT_583157, partial [Lophiostoma macrostomum CBS 122681]
DPFDTLLTLEDTLYTNAYALGASDGARAGRIEGRIFGLEKGFEKFAAMGALHGRSCVWGSRISLPTPQTQTSSGDSSSSLNETAKDVEGKDEAGITAKEQEVEEADPMNLPSLPPNPRLQKHITTLHALSDPPTFSTSNTEDAVADFDDRLKRAGAKAKIIERIINETSAPAPAAHEVEGLEKGAANPRSASRRTVKLSGEGKKQNDDSIEDFAGSRLLR